MKFREEDSEDPVIYFTNESDIPYTGRKLIYTTQGGT